MDINIGLSIGRRIKIWFKSVGVTGESGDWTDADMDAAFSLLGLDFDFLLTVGDSQVSKLARRYAYNNKLHCDFDGADTGRVKKVRSFDDLANGGILVAFIDDIIFAEITPDRELMDVYACKKFVEEAMEKKIPVIIFPSGFRQNMEKKWSK